MGERGRWRRRGREEVSFFSFFFLREGFFLRFFDALPPPHKPTHLHPLAHGPGLRVPGDHRVRQPPRQQRAEQPPQLEARDAERGGTGVGDALGLDQVEDEPGGDALAHDVDEEVGLDCCWCRFGLVGERQRKREKGRESEFFFRQKTKKKKQKKKKEKKLSSNNSPAPCPRCTGSSARWSAGAPAATASPPQQHQKRPC